MLDPNVKLVTQVHAGGGGGGHQAGRTELTADGQRVVAWARTLPQRQNAAVVTAFGRLGLQVTDTGLTKDQYGHVQAGNAPPRYDFHTGAYYDSESGTEVKTVICTDQSLLVAKGHR